MTIRRDQAMQIRVTKLMFTLILLLTCTGLWAADDPLMGAWNLNLKKSKYNPGPAPKSATYIYQPKGADGVIFISDGVGAQGNATHVEYTATYDEKDCPVTGDPSRDAVSIKRIDPYTFEETSKKGGAVTSTLQFVVSKNGKTLTITSKGTNTINAVYDKE
jgi:hypothetical protein